MPSKVDSRVLADRLQLVQWIHLGLPPVRGEFATCATKALNVHVCCA